MPLLKRKSKKPAEMSEESDQPAKSGSVMMAYDVMRKARRKKMAQGGEVKAGDVSDHPSDEEDRSNVLFDGKAERIDPLEKVMNEDKQSEDMQYGKDEDDEASEDIVSRIMRKMRRK